MNRTRLNFWLWTFITIMWEVTLMGAISHHHYKDVYLPFIGMVISLIPTVINFLALERNR